MKKIILEEVVRIQELMNIKKPLISEGIGDIIRKLGTTVLGDVSSFFLKVGDDIKNDLKFANAGIEPQTLDEIVEIMNRDAPIARKVLKQLALVDNTIADLMALAFTTSTEYATDWNRAASSLTSFFPEKVAEGENILRTIYGLPDNVIEILKRDATSLYELGHDANTAQKVLQKQNVIKKLKTFKNITNITDPELQKVIDDATKVLTEAELTALISKRVPNFSELYKLAGKSYKSDSTFEQIIESAGFRLGPEGNRLIASWLKRGEIFLKGGKSSKEQLLNWILRLGVSGALYAGAASDIFSVYGEIKELSVDAVDTAGNLTITDNELKVQIMPLVNNETDLKNKEVASVKKQSNRPPLTAIVYFKDGTDVKYVWNKEAKRYEREGGTPTTTPTTEKYTDDEASFKKWMAKQKLPGTPTKSNIGGFDLNGINYQLNSDNSGFE
jgi:hypothetical protein